MFEVDVKINVEVEKERSTDQLRFNAWIKASPHKTRNSPSASPRLDTVDSVGDSVHIDLCHPPYLYLPRLRRKNR